MSQPERNIETRIPDATVVAPDGKRADIFLTEKDGSFIASVTLGKRSIGAIGSTRSAALYSLGAEIGDLRLMQKNAECQREILLRKGTIWKDPLMID